MSTIQCPGCKQILEGEFEMADELKCPACGTTFVPERLVSSPHKPVGVSQRTAFSPRSSESSRRPKEVVWAVSILMVLAIVSRGLYFLAFVIGTVTSQWTMASNASRMIFLWFPSSILSLFFAWKLYRGRAWARSLFTWWLLPVGFVASIGLTPDYCLQASLNGANIPDWLWRGSLTLIFLVNAAIFGTPLYLINRKAMDRTDTDFPQGE